LRTPIVLLNFRDSAAQNLQLTTVLLDFLGCPWIIDLVALELRADGGEFEVRAHK